MATRNCGKTPTPETNDYINRVDRRRRGKERLLNAPYIESSNFSPFKVHEKRHDGYIQFRVSPFAARTIAEVASLFNMSSSQYAKSVLFRDVGLVFEPVDRRRKKK